MPQPTERQSATAMAKLGQVAVHAFALGAAAAAILIASVVADKQGWGSGRPQVEA